MNGRARNVDVDGDTVCLVPADLAGQLAEFIAEAADRMPSTWWRPDWLDVTTSTLRATRLAATGEPGAFRLVSKSGQARQVARDHDDPLRAVIGVEEAAGLLGCGGRTVRRLVESGELPARTIGRQVVLPLAAVESYEAHHR